MYKGNLRGCQLCELRMTCNEPVHGDGSLESPLMFIGEAPGREEDEQGRPFVGRAGKLLDWAINHIGFERRQVFVSNLVKCRPPDNRDPKPEEVAACKRWLGDEIGVLLACSLQIIVPLGRFASEFFKGSPIQIMKERGKPFKRKFRGKKLVVMTLLHPAWLLRGNREQNKWKYERDLMRLRWVVNKLGVKP